MDTNMETDSIVDTEMDHDDDAAQEKAEDGKPTYKSFKKKFRKIKVKFDEAMRQNNDFYIKEQQAVETARHLAQQNDQLLDLLLDVNNSRQMPLDMRFDLSTEVPALNPVPPLISDDDLLEASKSSTAEGKALYAEITALLKERAALEPIPKPPQSLAHLLQTVPHITQASPLAAESLSALQPEEGQATPLGYLTLDQLDDHLYDVDATLGLVPPVPPTLQTPPTQDLAFTNPNSPYNWLRKNVPNIFLQDGEGSEKSHGKPGALRGAGKRASIPAPSKPGALEFVEEDGLEYDASLTAAALKVQTKRKRGDEDDGGYHPKLGTPADGKGKKPRVARKKKSDTSEETATPTGKGKGSRGPRKKKVEASEEIVS